MAIRQTYKLPGTDSVANYKDWAMDVGAALTAIGWQQTADTGQINWSTFSPASFPQNTTQGYEIWKSTDSLSTTCPMYLKIYYGVRNYTTAPNNSPAILIGFGFGSDGYGNLLSPFYTGLWGSYVGVPGFNTTGTVTIRVEQNYSWYGSGGSFAMVLFGHQGFQVNAAQVLVVERSHDANGNDTDEYVTVWFTGYQNSQYQSFFKPVSLTNSASGASGPYVSNTGGFILPDGSASGAGVGGVAWSPFFPSVGRVGYPSRMIAGFKWNGSADVADNMVVQCQIYGTTQNYLTFRQNRDMAAMMPGGYNQQNNSNNQYATLGIRWDAGA